MRRFTLTIVASITALTLLPAGALARDHAEHHQRQHERRHHHVQPASVGHEQIGSATTVRSFNDGVLTLALSDGSTVSGRVTDGTEIECEMVENDNLRADRDGGSDHRGGDDGDRGGDNGDRGDDNGGRGDDNQSCLAGDLVAGAVVGSANLAISGSGAIWDKVELIG